MAVKSPDCTTVPRLTHRAYPEWPSLLPGKAHPHGKHSDPSFLQLLGWQGHVSLGPPVSDDDEDLGHRGVSAPREPSAQEIFQSEACLCGSSSELTREGKSKGDIGRQPETVAPPLAVTARFSWQRSKW